MSSVGRSPSIILKKDTTDRVQFNPDPSQLLVYTTVTTIDNHCSGVLIVSIIYICDFLHRCIRVAAPYKQIDGGSHGPVQCTKSSGRNAQLWPTYSEVLHHRRARQKRLGECDWSTKVGCVFLLRNAFKSHAQPRKWFIQLYSIGSTGDCWLCVGVVYSLLFCICPLVIWVAGSLTQLTMSTKRINFLTFYTRM